MSLHDLVLTCEKSHVCNCKASAGQNETLPKEFNVKILAKKETITGMSKLIRGATLRRRPIHRTVGVLIGLAVLGAAILPPTAKADDDLVVDHSVLPEDCARPGQLIPKHGRHHPEQRLYPSDFFTVVANAGPLLHLAECEPVVDGRGRIWLIIRAALSFEGLMTRRHPETGIWQTSITLADEDHDLSDNGKGICLNHFSHCKIKLLGNEQAEVELLTGIKVPGRFRWLRHEKRQQIY
jgi:hypothetical protein